MLNIKHEQQSHMFELTLVVKDAKGQPTGVRKSISTDSPSQLWSFWIRHQGRKHKPKHKKTEKVKGAKKSKERLPSKEEAEHISLEFSQGFGPAEKANETK